LNEESTQVLNFCRIQLTLLAEKEERLRKEILDCKIQREFLMQMIGTIDPAHTEGAET
jgi:hypothetical protein